MFKVVQKQENDVDHTEQMLRAQSFLSRREFFGTTTLLLLGCSSENESTSINTKSSPSIVNKKNNQITDRKPYFFRPPLVAPSNYSIVKPKDGFSEEEAFYLNNAIYLLKKVFESAAQNEMANEIERVSIRPFTPQMEVDLTIGGGKAFARYQDGIIYINSKSSSFRTYAQAYFELASSVAHEFCHHLAKDKPMVELDKDATPLFDMEVRAHQRTTRICQAIEEYINKIEDAPIEDKAKWQEMTSLATYFSQGLELRYEARRDVCQKIINLVRDVHSRLEQSGTLSQEIDAFMGRLILLGYELREAPDNGPAELQGYRLLLNKTRELGERCKLLPGFNSNEFFDELKGMSIILMNLEQHLSSKPATLP